MGSYNPKRPEPASQPAPEPDYKPVWSVDPSKPYVLGEIQTVSGRRVRPTELSPDDVDPLDIAHALANQCRFTGHTRKFYSVAQHCYYVSRLLVPPSNVPSDPGARRVQLAGLLHDASEAYLLDLPSPIKNLPELAAFKALEKSIHAAIEKRFGFDPGSFSTPEVKGADRKMLATEARDLMHREGFNLDRGVEACAWRVVPVRPKYARELWLNRFYELGGC
jgi:hypothetical protein